MYVAMRILLTRMMIRSPFEVKVRPPHNQYEIVISGAAGRSPDAQPTDGLFSFVAAVGLGLPLPVAGRYMVEIILAGEIARELPIVVTMQQPEG